MVYKNEFKELKISAIGFGTMRMPLKSEDKADVDICAVDEMVDYAIANGINYFDTAYMYHDHVAENVIGKSLSRYPRDKWLLATKYPGHEIHETYNPQKTFEEQLSKCGVEYFDFYLMHNVNERSIKNYLNADLGIKEYFEKEKKEGRIKHLGFSCHGDTNCIEQFLDAYGDIIEFCQIQLNYLDWTLQDAKSKYEYLTKRGIPVWVMEPCRGGRLAHLDDVSEEKLEKMRPGESVPSWAFHFLQGLDNVKMVLSGMSSLEQMKDNVKTFEKRTVLTDSEKKTLLDIAEGMKNTIPCTACRYCCEGCPMGIDIPKLISIYNDFKFYPSVNTNIRLGAIEEGHRPCDCIGCGQCAAVCPQKIDIPSYMSKMSEEFSRLQSWEDICRQRDEINKKNNNNKNI